MSFSTRCVRPNRSAGFPVMPTGSGRRRGPPRLGFAIPADQATVLWDGTDASGVPAPPGLYSFAVNAAADGEAIPGAVAETYNRVAEVRLEGGVPRLVFETGSTIEASAVTALRAGSA